MPDFSTASLLAALSACALSAGVTLTAAAQPTTDVPLDEGPGDAVEVPAWSEDEQISYALGWFFGQQAEGAFEADLDVDAFMEGFASSLGEPSAEELSRAFGTLAGLEFQAEGETIDLSKVRAACLAAATEDGVPELSEQEMQMAMMIFSQREQQRAAREAEQAAQAFLLDKAAEEGAVAMDNGLIVRVIMPGPDASVKPVIGDTVRLNYELSSMAGEIIQTTFGDEPVDFPLTDGLIEGFRVGVTSIPVGGTYELTIPPALGYGAGGPRPNEALVFKVQVLEILPPAGAEGGIPGPPPSE